MSNARAGDDLPALMAAYQAGAIEAFDALYEYLAPSLLHYLAAATRDRAHAQDLLQETFLQIHRSRRACRTGLPVRPWVFAIARHVALMDAGSSSADPSRSSLLGSHFRRSRRAGARRIPRGHPSVGSADAGHRRAGRAVGGPDRQRAARARAAHLDPLAALRHE